MIDSATLSKCRDIIQAELDALDAEIINKIQVENTPQQTADALAGIAYERAAIQDLRQKLLTRLNSQKLKLL